MSSALGQFRAMVEGRGARLRQLPFRKLQQLGNEPTERVVVDSRKGTIDLVVLTPPSGSVQVVVQGFLKHRLMPWKDVALDGFYKYPDETVGSMTEEEFWDFD